MPEHLYELKEVAATLSRTDTLDEQTRIMRHIRHWTTLDLLSPKGEKHTGTGRSRKYTAEEIRKAAVLEELSRWRVPMTIVADNFDSVLGDFSEVWEQAGMDTKPVYLVMCWNTTVSGWNMTINEPNLQMIMDRPNRKAAAKGENFETPASAIVINITRLFRWLNL